MKKTRTYKVFLQAVIPGIFRDQKFDGLEIFEAESMKEAQTKAEAWIKKEKVDGAVVIITNIEEQP